MTTKATRTHAEAFPACAEKLDDDHDEALRSLDLDDDVDQGPLFDAPRTPGYGFDRCGWKR